jgi:hypothetical protein
VFQPIRFVVTAASCFSACGGYDGIKPTYVPETLAPNPIQSLSAGGTKNFDVHAPAAMPCGSPTVDCNIVFKNSDNAVIFELRARFHCAQCPANRPANSD